MVASMDRQREASAGGRRRGGSVPSRAAAILVGVLLLLGTGLLAAGVAATILGESWYIGPPPVAGDASTRLVFAGAEATPTAALQTPTPDVPTPHPEPPPRLAIGSLATVAAERLNFREGPDQSAPVHGTLNLGTALYVVSVVEGADDLVWYEVAITGLGDCAPGACPGDVGWVAEGGSAPEPWLQQAEVACPDFPISATDLDSLLPLTRFYCYGAAELIVEGTLEEVHGDTMPIVYEPAWLASPVAPFFFSGTQVGLHFESGVRPSELSGGTRARVFAAMEHSASSTCSAYVHPAFVTRGGEPPSDAELGLPSPVEVILQCRTRLVVNGWEVLP